VILTHDLVLALVNFSDLEHSVVRVDTFSFTLLAKIVIFNLSARVANALNRINTTLIT